MSVELEEMNCWVRDIFNFSLSSTFFFFFIYFLFVDFIHYFFRLSFFSFYIFLFINIFLFFIPINVYLSSFHSFFGTNRKLVERLKMVKIFSMSELLN